MARRKPSNRRTCTGICSNVAYSPDADHRFPPNPITSFLIPISHRSEATLDSRL